MTTATRIDQSVPETVKVRSGAASPLDAIHMSAHQRRQAERDMRTAEQLVDFAFDVVAGCKALVRRLRGVRVVAH